MAQDDIIALLKAFLTRPAVVEDSKALSVIVDLMYYETLKTYKWVLLVIYLIQLLTMMPSLTIQEKQMQSHSEEYHPP